MWIQSLGQEDPLEKSSQPRQHSCLETCMDRERSLAGYSAWGLKESNTTVHVYKQTAQAW